MSCLKNGGTWSKAIMLIVSYVIIKLCAIIMPSRFSALKCEECCLFGCVCTSY